MAGRTKARSIGVLLAMTGTLVAGTLIGFQLLTASAELEPVEQCERQTIAKGEPVTPSIVTVDVFNASRRAGLANRVSINLQRRGFVPGQVGNSETEPTSDGVTIVTNTPKDARVRLVASQFGKVQFIKPETDPEDDAETRPADDTVVVLVGNATNEDLARRPAESVKSDREFSICIPTPEDADSAS